MVPWFWWLFSYLRSHSSCKPIFWTPVLY